MHKLIKEWKGKQRNECLFLFKSAYDGIYNIKVSHFIFNQNWILDRSPAISELDQYTTHWKLEKWN